MTGPSLDLDALREKAEKATPGPWKRGRGPFDVDSGSGWIAETAASRDATYVAAASPDVILAVLALVEEQRARISTLEEALRPFSALAEHAVERGEGGYGHWLHNTGKEQISTWLGPTDFLHARDALAGPPTEEATDA